MKGRTFSSFNSNQSILSDFETYELTPSRINVKTNRYIDNRRKARKEHSLKKTSKNPVIFPITFIKKIEMTFI